MFSNCKDKCKYCYIYYIGGCLAGNGDDDFIGLTKNLFDKLTNNPKIKIHKKEQLTINFSEYKKREINITNLSKSINIKKSIDIKTLIELLLNQPWHQKCSFIPHYIPKGCRGKEDEDKHAYFAIIYNDGTEYPPELRYSKGPKQGFFWDVYGDDMRSIELAIIALANAPAPVNVCPITFKFKPEKEK